MRSWRATSQVALGHLDPDLGSVSRQAGTPGRVAEYLILTMLTAGLNGELFTSGLRWQAWAADAATAFLQGAQDTVERKLPLYLKPPSDGVIKLTQHWKARLYRIRGNIYGLCNAPLTWYREVSKRLESINYRKHSFDACIFYKTTQQEDREEIVSIILVYVDDFLGIYRQDYPIEEVRSLFRWGSITDLEPYVPVTFKGKELEIQRNEAGRFVLKLTMKKFLNNLSSGSLKRGRQQESQDLSMEEQKELRSICGCLQWVSTQTRPDLASTVSLTPHGNEAKLEHLKVLFEAIEYLHQTSDDGLVFQDIPFNASTTMVAYSDASFANARKSGSQIGLVIGLTTPDVLERPTTLTVVDWRSTRSPRVCRSTLAAEATAADEAADRTG